MNSRKSLYRRLLVAKASSTQSSPLVALFSLISMFRLKLHVPREDHAIPVTNGDAELAAILLAKTAYLEILQQVRQGLVTDQ